MLHRSRFTYGGGRGASQQAIRALDWKQSARLATAAALPAVTASGTGPGHRLTADANGALSVDGVSVVAEDRVLVKNQAAGADNGIYRVVQAGSGGTPFILERAADADESSEVTAGMTVPVAEGTVNADTLWILTTNDPITVDTTALSFSEFGVAALTGTPNVSWTVNNDAAAGTDEDPFLELQGGDGTNLVKLRQTLETTNERLQVTTTRDGTEIGSAMHLGTPGANLGSAVSDLVLNHGNAKASGMRGDSGYAVVSGDTGVQIRSGVFPGTAVNLEVTATSVTVGITGSTANPAFCPVNNDTDTGFSQVGGTANNLDVISGTRNSARFNSGSTANGSKDLDLMVNRADGASPPVYSLQRVSHFDPGNAGINFTAGQKVLVIG